MLRLMTNWQIKNYTNISVAELYQILRLRQEVFIIEQNCIYPDIDDKDHNAMHLLGTIDNKLIAYARLFQPDDYLQGYSSIGRVVVAKQKRGQQIGHALIKHAVHFLKTQYPHSPCKISAQAYLMTLYQSFDFIAEGNTYLEDGIPHIAMIKI